MQPFFDVLDHAVGATIAGFVVWVIFGTLRRYLLARSNAAIQEKVFSRIDSTPALLQLAANDSGRRFLESLTLERTEPVSPMRRILQGIQTGVVLTCVGVALLWLHHIFNYDSSSPGILVFGTAAVGLGIGFCIASVASLMLSRSLGLLRKEGLHDGRG